MELVIFDLDGVIVSTDKYHYEAWKSLADEHNLLFSHEINSMLRGVSRAECLKIILDVNGRVVSSVDSSEMLLKKNTIYQDKLHALSENDILPGFLKLLNDLKVNNIPVAIGSSSRNTPLILKKIGLDRSFDTVVDGNCIDNSKPHPEVFLKCAEQLGKNPLKCVVYEDAIAGVDAGIAAGMMVIGVGTEKLTGVHKMVKTLENESNEIINNLYKEVFEV